MDEKYGLVGVPDWETIVHLDDEHAKDAERIKSELVSLLNQEPPSIEEEPRVFELLSQLELLGPAVDDGAPGILGVATAPAAAVDGSPWSGARGSEGGCRARPHDPECAFACMPSSRREDPLATFDEAERIAAAPGVPVLDVVSLHQHPRDSSGAGP